MRILPCITLNVVEVLGCSVFPPIAANTPALHVAVSSSSSSFFQFLNFFFIIIARLLYSVPSSPSLSAFFSRAFRNSRYVRWFGVNGPGCFDARPRGPPSIFPPLPPPPPLTFHQQFTTLEATSPSDGGGGQVYTWQGRSRGMHAEPSRAVLLFLLLLFLSLSSLSERVEAFVSRHRLDSRPLLWSPRSSFARPGEGTWQRHGCLQQTTTFYISFFSFFFFSISSPLFSALWFSFFFMLSMRLSAIDEVTGLVADTTTHFPFLCGTSVPCAAPPPNSVNGSTHVCVCVLEKWKAIKNKDGDGARSASCVCSRAVFWTQPAVETFSRFCACGWLTLDVTIAPSASIAMQPSFTSSTPFMLILAWLFPDQTRWAVTSFPSSVLYNPLAPPDGEINQKRTLLSVYFRSKPCALNSVARRRRQKGPKEFEGFFYTKRKRKVWLLSITTRSASASLLYLSVPTIIT